MKNLTKASLWLLLTGVMILAVASCEKHDKSDNLLVVERQRIELNSAHNGEAKFAIDIPVFGPQQLIDSLKVFLNHELYEAMESSFESSWDLDSVHFTEKEMFQDNLLDMMPYYANKYKPFKDEVDNMGGFSLLLIAQTESFVTYGLELWGCGGSCGAALYCHTFSKNDGHKIGETITKENLLRFINDHPETKQPFAEYEIDDDIWLYFDLGLLEEGAICVNEAWQNHYLADLFDYKDIMPYLSKEAQQLIKKKGTTKYSYEDWSIGEQIGRVETTDHETIFLMYRPPLWDGFASFAEGSYFGDDYDNEDENDILRQDEAYTLMAYTKKDGQYIRKDVFPTARFEFVFPDVAWSGPSTFDDGDYFVFDEDQNILFVPYVTKNWYVDYAPYKFDGQKFVSASEGKAPVMGLDE